MPIDLEILADDSKLVDLCKRYWQLDSEYKFVSSVSAIARELNIPANGLSKTVSEYCRAHSTEITCERCGSRYIYRNRSDFQQNRSYDHVWVCGNCIAEERAQQESAKQVLEQKRRKLIQESYDLTQTRKPIDIRTLSFDQAVYLLSFIRTGVSEDFSFVNPMNSIPSSTPFAPTKELHYEVIRMLFGSHLIYVDPDSPSNAFGFEDDETGIEHFYLDYVKWALPIRHETGKPEQFVAELEHIFLNMDWPDTWFDRRIPFWKKLALHECLQYLIFSLEQHGFEFKPGEKTYLVFNNLLEDHSVAQAYNLIWRASKDAAAFYVREKVPKQHAANTVVGSIQRQLERARSEGWEIKPFRRDFRCRQSMISQVLYNAVLHIGDDGFTKPIT